MATIRMNIIQKARRAIFWSADTIKGGKIHTHYKEVKSLNENYIADTPQMLLSELLSHAVKTVPFYSSAYGKSIDGFPVINKNTIRDNFESFRTIDLKFRNGTTAVTSGSTGTPFQVIHDKRKRLRNSADTIYFGEKANFSIGQRLYYFKIWNKINSKSKFTLFAQNLVPCDVLNLDDSAIARMIDRIQKDNTEKGFLAYSSVYDSVCRYLKKINFKGADLNIKAIISMSESLNSQTKISLHEIFKIHSVSRYSNVENGIIAQQLPDGSDDFIINEASYYVELLEINSDKNAAIGVPGRIVVTDLFNYSMPMIRYDTGDIGILGYSELYKNHRLVLKSIEGRKMDLIYNTEGSLVSSYVITNNMWKYTEILQYQFIQIDRKKYKFKLNTNLPFKREQDLLTEFKSYLGNDASIEIEYVEGIPLLASGKRRKVVNEVSQNLFRGN